MRTVWIVLLVMSLTITGVMVYAATSLTTTVEIDNTTSKTVVFHLDNIIVNENISLPAGTLYYNKNPTILQYPYNVTIQMNNVVLGGNTTLTPQLWDWWFDGVDDYIEITDNSGINFSEGITLFTIIKPNEQTVTTNVNIIEKKGSAPIIWSGNGKPYFGAIINGTWYRTTTTNTIQANTRYLVSASYDKTTLALYINNTNYGTTTINGIIDTSLNPITIGTDNSYTHFYSGTIEYMEIHNKTTIYNNNIINTTGLVLFLTPTAFNGTHYIDLTGNGYDGVPYGGVERVPSGEKWLWLVEDATSDNLVHLRFFPVGTIIKFVNTDTNTQTIITINGTTNAAGLVEDHTINIPAGNYTIEYLGGYTVFGESNNYILYYIPTENEIITAYKNGTIVNETTLNQPLTLPEDTIVYGPITIEYVLDNNNNVLAEAHYGGYNASNIAYAPTDSPEILYHASSGNGTITITGVRQGTRISIPTLSQYYNATGAPITITGAMTYKILYYYTENKIYIYTSQKPEDIDLVGLIQPENMIEFYKQWWGAWAYIIPYLLPVSIYIARRSVGLFTATTILIGAAQITFMPEGLRGIGAVGIAFGLTILIYTLVRRRE